MRRVFLTACAVDAEAALLLVADVLGGADVV